MAFRPKNLPAAQKKESRRFLNLRGVAFQGALLAGLVAGALTWAGGQYLMQVDFQAQAKESGITLLAQAQAMAKEIGRPLGKGDQQRALKAMNNRLRGLPEATAYVLDTKGATLLGNDPDGGVKSLTNSKTTITRALAARAGCSGLFCVIGNGPLSRRFGLSFTIVSLCAS